MDAANSPAPTYEPSAAWWAWNQVKPEPSRLPTSVTTTSAAAASGSVRKFVRGARAGAARPGGRAAGARRRPRRAAPGSSAGAAPSLATVQKRSATPTTKTVISSQATASSGVQSIHSGATRAGRAAAHPRRTWSSAGPADPARRDERGERPEEHGAEQQRRQQPRAEDGRDRQGRCRGNHRRRTPPDDRAPAGPAATAPARRARPPTPPVSWALHSRRSGGSATARRRRARGSPRRGRRKWGARPLAAARVMPPAYPDHVNPRPPARTNGRVTRMTCGDPGFYSASAAVFVAVLAAVVFFAAVFLAVAVVFLAACRLLRGGLLGGRLLRGRLLGRRLLRRGLLRRVFLAGPLARFSASSSSRARP